MLWSTQTPPVLPKVMFPISRFIAEPQQHTVRCVRLRAGNGVLFAALGCTARRADGVPAFLS